MWNTTHTQLQHFAYTYHIGLKSWSLQIIYLHGSPTPYCAVMLLWCVTGHSCSRPPSNYHLEFATFPTVPRPILPVYRGVFMYIGSSAQLAFSPLISFSGSAPAPAPHLARIHVVVDALHAGCTSPSPYVVDCGCFVIQFRTMPRHSRHGSCRCCASTRLTNPSQLLSLPQSWCLPPQLPSMPLQLSFQYPTLYVI